MDEKTVKEVMAHHRKGNDVLLGVDNFGNVKIKVKCGLFGLSTKRYSVDHETFAEIKRRMKWSDSINLENG